MPLVEEATESKEGHFTNWSDFLLQGLHYGEALNLRGAIALLPSPLFPPPMVHAYSISFMINDPQISFYKTDDAYEEYMHLRFNILCKILTPDVLLKR